LSTKEVNQHNESLLIDVWNLAVELAEMDVANTNSVLEVDARTLKVAVVDSENSDDPKKLRLKALYKSSAGPLKITPMTGCTGWCHR